MVSLCEWAFAVHVGLGLDHINPDESIDMLACLAHVFDGTLSKQHYSSTCLNKLNKA